ncbi:unnamed protein product [Coffea canephora]|uniref:Uncharacterized protein n=1 Tax=Coffea canephora TaxID=49390 RepID=A0A068UFY1_COFCA|nr:unnamed protein product [Coffea canephora]
MKEKRKRDMEKNLPRKQRRKLEAAREKLEDDSEVLQGNDKSKKENAGISPVDLAYRRAKAVKAVKRAADVGKITRRVEKKSKHPSQKTQSRMEEMRELFQSDRSEKK